MPGRPSTRAPRGSTTTTARKTSGGTTRAARGSSARQSANAVNIPDEGPVTTLRTQIAQVFSDAQKTTATQRKLVVNLRKIQEACCFEPPDTGKKGGKKGQEEQEDFDEEEFNAEIVRCLLRIMSVKKSEPVGDRVIRFLGIFLKHASDKGLSCTAGQKKKVLIKARSTDICYRVRGRCYCLSRNAYQQAYIQYPHYNPGTSHSQRQDGPIPSHADSCAHCEQPHYHR